MLYIIKKDYFLADYILDAIKNYDNIRIIDYQRLKPHGVKRILHLSRRFIRTFLYNKSGLWTDDFFTHTFLTEIKKISATDKILFWGCENLKELLILNKEISNNNKNVFLWNPIATICRNFYSKWEYKYMLKKSRMKIFTFDPDDAIRYEFNTINQVYRTPNNNIGIPSHSNYEVYYIGVDKRRTKLLEFLKTEFDLQGITYNFKIVKDKHTDVSPNLAPYYIDKPIAYYESVDLIQQSDCILEILQKGLNGMTLRTLEALFMNKKLITTNQDISNYIFYSPANIYIIGGKERRSVKEFLNTPSERISDEIIQNYNITYWIKQFL